MNSGKRRCFKSISIFILLLIVLIGCQQASTSTNRVKFDIRGLNIDANETEYGTTFRNKATIVALGESSDTNKPYLVTIKITRISGGDPSMIKSYPAYTVIPVISGAGDFIHYGGLRTKGSSISKGETWEPEKIEVSIVGFVQMALTSENVVRTP